MPKKKSLRNSKVGSRAKAGSRKGIVTVRVHGSATAPRRVKKGRSPAFTLGLPGESNNSNGTRYEKPRVSNPSVPEEREKMLEKRAKLTLKAFRIAYENHHRS